VTIVVSAGNEGIDLDHDANLFADFCERPGVVCVSATGPNSSGPDFNGPFLPSVDAPAFYTNFGRSAIDVAAPGGDAVLDAVGNVLSAGWVWGPCSTTSLLIPDCQADIFVLGGIGTSFAAPHAAAVAALLVERLGRNPALVRARLEQSADQLGSSSVPIETRTGGIRA
jgi:subtilisin family serine protease